MIAGATASRRQDEGDGEADGVAGEDDVAKRDGPPDAGQSASMTASV